ncbi:MAG: polyprenyl synthetase family protein [Pseudomonadota bacterium]
MVMVLSKFGKMMNKALKQDATQAAPNGVAALAALTEKDMEKVNALILSRTGSDVLLILDVAKHLINSGGKRLRPMLTLASAALVQAKGDKVHKLAAAVEFMHTATLLHDDVVDKSDMRRGAKTARMLWGNEASVLVGDFLLGQAFRMMVETECLEALKVLSNAAAVIAEGEVMQLDNARKLRLTEKDYFKIITSKTAVLFSAACEVGPCLADSMDKYRTALSDYGMNLGIAFQLIDDILDYAGGIETGKAVGNDLIEGKVTLPVILSYQNGDAGQRAFWERQFSDDPIDEDEMTQAIDMLHSSGAIEATRERAEDYANKARTALEVFDESEMKAALLGVVDFCVERKF